MCVTTSYRKRGEKYSVRQDVLFPSRPIGAGANKYLSVQQFNLTQEIMQIVAPYRQKPGVGWIFSLPVFSCDLNNTFVFPTTPCSTLFFPPLYPHMNCPNYYSQAVSVVIAPEPNRPKMNNVTSCNSSSSSISKSMFHEYLNVMVNLTPDGATKYIRIILFFFLFFLRKQYKWTYSETHHKSQHIQESLCSNWRTGAPNVQTPSDFQSQRLWKFVISH